MPSDKWSAGVSQAPGVQQNKLEGGEKSGYTIALENMFDRGFIDAGVSYVSGLVGEDNARMLDLMRVTGAYYEAKKKFDGEHNISPKREGLFSEMAQLGDEMKSLQEKWEKEDEEK